MDRRAGAKLEEVRDNASKGLVDWDQDEHDFDFDYMQSFNNENLLDHQPARLVLSPPWTPSPQLQNPPQTDPRPRQSPPQIAPHPNPPPPLLDDEVFEILECLHLALIKLRQITQTSFQSCSKKHLLSEWLT